MKPPVEAPMSAQTLSFGSISNCLIAASSLWALRLTNSLRVMVIWESEVTSWPGFLARWWSIKTWPSLIRLRACERVGTRFSVTRNWSRRMV